MWSPAQVRDVCCAELTCTCKRDMVPTCKGLWVYSMLCYVFGMAKCNRIESLICSAIATFWCNAIVTLVLLAYFKFNHNSGTDLNHRNNHFYTCSIPCMECFDNANKLGKKFLWNYISVKDGPEKRTETIKEEMKAPKKTTQHLPKIHSIQCM